MCIVVVICSGPFQMVITYVRCVSGGHYTGDSSCEGSYSKHFGDAFHTCNNIQGSDRSQILTAMHIFHPTAVWDMSLLLHAAATCCVVCSILSVMCSEHIQTCVKRSTFCTYQMSATPGCLGCPTASSGVSLLVRLCIVSKVLFSIGCLQDVHNTHSCKGHCVRAAPFYQILDICAVLLTG